MTTEPPGSEEDPEAGALAQPRQFAPQFPWASIPMPE